MEAQNRNTSEQARGTLGLLRARVSVTQAPCKHMLEICHARVEY